MELKRVANSLRMDKEERKPLADLNQKPSVTDGWNLHQSASWTQQIQCCRGIYQTLNHLHRPNLGLMEAETDLNHHLNYHESRHHRC